MSPSPASLMVSESSRTTSTQFLEFLIPFRNEWLIIIKNKKMLEGGNGKRRAPVLFSRLSLTMVLLFMFFVFVLFSCYDCGENHSRLPRRVPLDRTAPLAHQGWTSASDKSVQMVVICLKVWWNPNFCELIYLK